MLLILLLIIAISTLGIYLLGNSMIKIIDDIDHCEKGD